MDQFQVQGKQDILVSSANISSATIDLAHAPNSRFSGRHGFTGIRKHDNFIDPCYSIPGDSASLNYFCQSYFKK